MYLNVDYCAESFIIFHVVIDLFFFIKGSFDWMLNRYYLSNAQFHKFSLDGQILYLWMRTWPRTNIPHYYNLYQIHIFSDQVYSVHAFDL